MSRENVNIKKSGQELLHCPLKESGWQDSNLRPLGPKPSAIPGYATPRDGIFRLSRRKDILFIVTSIN
jgi:hypothetical protein